MPDLLSPEAIARADELPQLDSPGFIDALAESGNPRDFQKFQRIFLSEIESGEYEVYQAMRLSRDEDVQRMVRRMEKKASEEVR